MAPMKKLIIASAIGGAACANTAEVHTSNLNGGGGAFDNLKASWGKALNIGSHKTNMNCKYDYSANKDFLKEVSFSGDLTNAGDVSVQYEVTRDFKSKDTEVKLTAASQARSSRPPTTTTRCRRSAPSATSTLATRRSTCSPRGSSRPRPRASR